MKRYLIFSMAGILLSGLFMFSNSAQAQQMQPNFANTKKIEVTGSSEMEVIPDEIYFSISLREYFKDKDKNKVEITALEKQLQTAVNAAGVPKENFQIENIYGYRYWPDRKKPVDFLESKRYVLKLNNLSKVDEIMAKVDAKGIEFVNISRYEHSKIEQYRKEIKTKALIAAREKATYLLQGIGEQISGILEVQESGGNDGDYPMPIYRASNMMLKAEAMQDAVAAEPEIDFKKIKIRYEIRAVFAIK